jgi:hypothetical protein
MPGLITSKESLPISVRTLPKFPPCRHALWVRHVRLLKRQSAHESVQFELLRNDASLGWLFGEQKEIPQCSSLWILHEVAHGLCDAKLSSESISHPLPKFTGERLAGGHGHLKCKWGN